MTLQRRSTQQFSITVPKEMAGLVKNKVETGEYATESEVFRAGVRALLARDRAMDNWLLGQLGPAFDALRADKGHRVTADDVRAILASVAAEPLEPALGS